MVTSKLFDLSGKIALVTGASRGIGEEAAKQLAAHGAHVIVSSRKLEACEAVAQSIIAEGNSAEAMACLLYTSPSPRDRTRSRMPSSA